MGIRLLTVAPNRCREVPSGTLFRINLLVPSPPRHRSDIEARPDPSRPMSSRGKAAARPTGTAAPRRRGPARGRRRRRVPWLAWPTHGRAATTTPTREVWRGHRGPTMSTWTEAREQTDC